MSILQSLLSLALSGSLMFSSGLQAIAPHQDVDGTLFLANRQWMLSENYAPIVVEAEVKGQVRSMRPDAAAALKEMFDACREEAGVTLVSVSGYRSYRTQNNIYQRKLRNVKGNVAKAQEYVAPPGASEHQLGLAMDIGQQGKNGLAASFGKTKGGVWARENSWRFGFILRYDEPWEEITGYKYEPWHFRYVGEEAAREISRRGVTFEEYMTAVIPYPEGLDTTSSGASSAPREINHEASLYFSENDYFNMTNTKTRRMLSHYPTYQQTTEYTCGPAAALTVLSYYGNRDYNEMALARAMKTSDTVGTNLLSMVNFFKGIGWQVETGLGSMPFATYGAFGKFVWDSLGAGKPIMVENVDWAGHWRVIIGYDTMGTESSLDDTLILVDPYDTCDHKQDGYVVANGEKFYSMWFDHHLFPKKQRNQPWLIAQPGR